MLASVVRMAVTSFRVRNVPLFAVPKKFYFPTSD